MSDYELEATNSGIQVFKSCKRRWWLSQYRGLQPQTNRVTGPLALGSRIHAALEAYYTDRVDPLEAHAELLQHDRAILLDEFRDITELEDEGELGRIMLEGYMQWADENGFEAQYEVVAAEQVITAPIMDDKVLLKGKLDMRLKRRTDGVRLMADFKTVGTSFTEFTKNAHMDEQQLFYHLLESLQEDEDARSDGGLFILLKKVKRASTARPPFYDLVEVRHNDAQLATFWGRTFYTILEMLALKEALDSGKHDPRQIAYPTPTRDCSWKCNFYQVCPMFDDGSDAERYIADHFQVGNPDARYEPKLLPLTIAGKD
jgi:RecB family exonuclease